MTTSESKGRFFYKKDRFESIRITNRIDSNRELECSTRHEPSPTKVGPTASILRRCAAVLWKSIYEQYATIVRRKL